MSKNRTQWLQIAKFLQEQAPARKSVSARLHSKAATKSGQAKRRTLLSAAAAGFSWKVLVTPSKRLKNEPNEA